MHHGVLWNLCIPQVHHLCLCKMRTMWPSNLPNKAFSNSQTSESTWKQHSVHIVLVSHVSQPVAGSYYGCRFFKGVSVVNVVWAAEMWRTFPCVSRQWLFTPENKDPALGMFLPTESWCRKKKKTFKLTRRLYGDAVLLHCFIKGCIAGFFGEGIAYKWNIVAWS